LRHKIAAKTLFCIAVLGELRENVGEYNSPVAEYDGNYRWVSPGLSVEFISLDEYQPVKFNRN